MTYDDDGFTLSTGRHVYAHCRLVSVPILETDRDDPLEFGEGYDGHFTVQNPEFLEYYREHNITFDLSPAEGIEICDAMLAAWQRRKVKLEAM